MNAALTQRMPAAPRWPVLFGLSAGVLLVHLWLLTDGLSFPSSLGGTQQEQLSESDLLSSNPSTQTSQGVPAAAAAPPRVLTSLVRWITPLPPPEPVVVEKPAERVARPAARPKPPPPPPALEPEPAPAPTVEAAAEPALLAQAPAEQAPVPADAPPQTQALSEPEPPTLAEAAVPPVSPQSADPTAPPAEKAAASANPGAPEVVASAPAPANLTAMQGGPGPAALAGDNGAKLALDQHLPPNAQLRYTVQGAYKGLQYNASGQLVWRHEGRSYEARTEIRAFLLGSRSQTSVGRISGQGLEPDRFGDRSRNERAAHFDREAQRIRFSNNAPDAPLLPGTQDQLSVSLQLGAMLNASASARSEGQTLSVPVSSASNAEVWRFQVGAEETLQLPAGTLQARKLTRPPRRDFDKTVELWLAPSLGHLPVRMRISEPNGNVVDQRLQDMPSVAASPTAGKSQP